LAAALVVAVAIMLIRNTFFESAEISALKRENAALEEHHETLQAEFIEVEEVINALSERNDNIYRKIYESEPVVDSSEVKTDAITGVFKQLLSLGWDNEDIVEETNNKIKRIQARSERESLMEVIKLMRENREMLAHLPAIQPVEEIDESKLASGFGMRINPYHKGRVMHFGIDFAVSRGHNIVATGAGRVVTVRKETKLETGYGNYVEIDHGYGYKTRYAHLGEIKVKQGERVSRGDILALSGNSGGSIAPHVHYEILKDGNQIDPIHFIIEGLDDHEYKRLQQQAKRENQSLD
jgi:murein DD-endopeptidase MepM/ murein hydrolase activator NlpD